MSSIGSNISQYKAFSVLVVDDEVGIQTMLKKALGKWFGLVDSASSVAEAEALKVDNHYDLIILDINLPGETGVEWLTRFPAQDRPNDVIFMTGYADLETAISALRLGATDFILKPFSLEQMMSSVSRCIDKRLGERWQSALAHEVERHVGAEIKGNSAQTKQLKTLIQQFAPSKASILVEGESGTGKELVARGIHQASERRGPFVPVNCGAIAPELLESELFGHASGAFTGAKKSREGLFRVANGGTLFLDEIGEMPLAMQSSLLRVLEQKAIRPVGTEKEIPVDVRVVAATNRDLEQEVKQGRFRADLFYRLNVLRIDVKPLRERKQDIQDLVPFFTRILAKELGIEEPKWAHQDIQALMGYNWPGNIRELRNLIERSILLRQSPASQLLGIEVAQPISVDTPELGEEGYPLEWSLKEVEKAHILSVVEKHQGNKSAAARDLGVARKTLERKFKEWGNESYPCV
ncbi:sigma-54-dependent transcriptional regulator [Vibrio ishigakensis]|uniref:sigma-54-dependent transcriptional regulator n=1 Tax=Vibrio ishigakensis TaxID=1481914 RepID=UPI0021C39943|nr:sigma-54 dependent transcriptional regulator [Vibrio ishigakensis]